MSKNKRVKKVGRYKRIRNEPMRNAMYELISRDPVIARMCRNLDIPVITFYKYYKECPKFKAEFDEARQAGMLLVEEELHKLALEGFIYEEEYTTEDGTVVTRKHVKWSPALITLMLKAEKPEKYRETKTEQTVNMCVNWKVDASQLTPEEEKALKSDSE